MSKPCEPAPALPCARRGWFGRAGRGRQGARALALAALLAACAPAAPPLPTAEPIVVDGSGPAANWLAARHAASGGDFRTAARLLRRAAAEDPGEPEIRRELLRALVAISAWEEAPEVARGLEALAPGDLDAGLLLHLDALRRGDAGEALERARDLDRPVIGRLLAPFLEAWALAAQGREDEALRALAGPERERVLPWLTAQHTALLLLRGGHTEAAALALESELAADRPLPESFVQAAAHVLQRAGRRDRAVALVGAQLRHRPGSSVLLHLARLLDEGRSVPPPFADPAGAVADVLLRFAEALDSQQARDRALRLARLALFAAPESAEARLLCARIELARGAPAEALRVLEGFPAGSPLAFDAALLRARALDALGRRGEAARLLEDLARRHPTRSEPLVTLGDLTRAREDWETAREAYARAIARLDRIERGHWRLFYAFGITLERTGRWEEAERAFRRALALEPDQPLVLNYLGYSLVDRGEKLEEAKRMLERAVELAPEDGYIVHSLGWAHDRLGDHGKAVELLERAVELAPDDPVIHDHLGDAYWKVGRRREARFQWNHALALDPEPELAAKIRRKLERGLEEDVRAQGP
ncbi:Beta-barrel assembly-enhancing protease [bacterium HR39]|nr:Beta-barrel assembly-enhancing protease [bacterium HR39]